MSENKNETTDQNDKPKEISQEELELKLCDIIKMSNNKRGRESAGKLLLSMGANSTSLVTIITKNSFFLGLEAWKRLKDPSENELRVIARSGKFFFGKKASKKLLKIYPEKNKKKY